MRKEISVLMGVIGAGVAIPVFWFSGGVGVFPNGIGLFLVDLSRGILSAISIASLGFVIILYVKDKNKLETLMQWFIAVTGLLLTVFTIAVDFSIQLLLGGILLLASGVILMEFIPFPAKRRY
ncbi:MAG: hypothetical protein HPY53_14405 [Brevinematales bacterium]|nr:hypothetical protein [Brevinematales bacterium]